MPEYIDRDKAIQDFKTCGAVFTYGVKVCNGIISRLLIQPTVDVAPVAHGKWKVTLTKDEQTIKCSNCGRVFDRFVNGAQLPEYCFCGAKMDESE